MPSIDIAMLQPSMAYFSEYIAVGLWATLGLANGMVRKGGLCQKSKDEVLSSAGGLWKVGLIGDAYYYYFFCVFLALDFCGVLCNKNSNCSLRLVYI